ncbi:hypothetical protein HanXRQr2_Chr01g0012881 [Helianthus annuus]|uniref:Uncharacterized protein n=1 Tax=Helianthus annuus TaxID=4232 RepID=A0A9K3P1L8_HELAN|nr:hypothetical protein HanXRQr2_Chr01g0012881 [Helianthus annuus]
MTPVKRERREESNQLFDLNREPLFLGFQQKVRLTMAKSQSLT